MIFRMIHGRKKKNFIKRPEEAESGKNRKPTEGKSKSITVSQLDGYEDYCRNMEDAFSKVILNGTNRIQNCINTAVICVK